MLENVMTYKEFLQKLKKNDLLNIINDYNRLVAILGSNKINVEKAKKSDLIDRIIDVKEDYLKYLVMSLDLEDYEVLKKIILKKTDISLLNANKELVNYLVSKKVFIQNDNLEVIKEVKDILKNYLKNKEVSNYIKTWDRIYKLADGVIVAYGVVERKYFDIIISGIVEHELIVPKLEYYYKRDYSIDNKQIVSNKLSNKKRINRYLKDNNYKQFTNKEYIAMGSCNYHHLIKSYKRFIKMLKTNYVFKKDDILFVDTNIVIPYLYNSLNEEELAKKNLEDTVIELFEFKGDKLKLKMLEEVMMIRDEFPLWEYRGFSKLEVNNK